MTAGPGGQVDLARSRKYGALYGICGRPADISGQYACLRLRPPSLRSNVGGVMATYTVRPGDSLSGIAAQFGTTWQVLKALNGIANENLIRVGQVLQLPGEGEEPEEENPDVCFYTVKPADTLSGIAARAGTTWQTIAGLNSIQHPNLIGVGLRLQLPGGTPTQM